MMLGNFDGLFGPFDFENDPRLERLFTEAGLPWMDITEGHLTVVVLTCGLESRLLSSTTNSLKGTFPATVSARVDVTMPSPFHLLPAIRATAEESSCCCLADSRSPAYFSLLRLLKFRDQSKVPGSRVSRTTSQLVPRRRDRGSVLLYKKGSELLKERRESGRFCDASSATRRNPTSLPCRNLEMMEGRLRGVSPPVPVVVLRYATSGIITRRPKQRLHPVSPDLHLLSIILTCH